MQSIKNTLEVIQLGSALAKAVISSNEDGKINTADLGQLINVMPYVGAAMEDIAMVPTELSDLDETEVKQINDAVVSMVGEVGHDKAQAIASASVDAAAAIYDLIKVIQSKEVA